MPGNTLPSSNSSEAPPPVEICDIWSARPAFSTAATESPPPMMVMQPLVVSEARVVAMALVPLAKASNSNTPIGPFQMTVLQLARPFCSVSMVSGPMSNPIQPSGMLSTGTTCVLASAAKRSATTTSDAKNNSTFFSFAMRSSFRASSNWSSSTSELPTESPLALRKVNTMPPPSTSLSTLFNIASITEILDDTLEPPTMAAKGLLGVFTAPCR
mmetsp:Transcript_4873/g.7245  ORF Transcript_4873/g.7245 Transcript_4873/m.7245 type:complete len:214 (-) Transcript_4873:20-661(-)